jgi:Ca2+-binding EF-hand superfamily protein
MLPVIKALDADEDGRISAAEIANASVALKGIDKDGDGTISAEEMRPDFEAMRRGGGPGGDQVRRGGTAGDAAGGGSFKERMMNLDANKDGKLAGDEIPERMRERMLERADSNGDGVLDAQELDKMAESFQRGGGGDQRRGGGAEGGKPKGAGEKPQRPAFE